MAISDALTSPPHWLAVLVTVTCVGFTVVLHYEALSRLNGRLQHAGEIRGRTRLLALMFMLVALHVCEIWLFGLGIHLTAYFPALGSIQGISDDGLMGAVYLSATTYSTLGFGDLVPHGPIRFLVGTEALTGLLMITWSASFTYLEMERYWRAE